MQAYIADTDPDVDAWAKREYILVGLLLTAGMLMVVFAVVLFVKTSNANGEVSGENTVFIVMGVGMVVMGVAVATLGVLGLCNSCGIVQSVRIYRHMKIHEITHAKEVDTDDDEDIDISIIR